MQLLPVNPSLGVFLTQATLFPCREPFPSPRLCFHVLAPGTCLSLAAAPPSHELYLAPFHPQPFCSWDFSQILSLTLSLTFCPQPMFSAPYIAKLLVSKPIFPVQLLSLASCLGTHCLPGSSQREARHLTLHICFVYLLPSLPVSEKGGTHLAVNWTPKSHPSLAAY
jgi:hypothetical protein